MKKQKSLAQFVLFTIVGFGPLVLAYAFLFFGTLLNVFISVSTDTPDIRIQFAILSITLPVFLGVSLYAGFYLFKRSTNWQTMVIILYGLWVILTAVPVFFITSSIGGISMAMVEGSITQADLMAASVREAFSLLLFLHIGIIPWVLGAAWVMGRFKIIETT